MQSSQTSTISYFYLVGFFLVFVAGLFWSFGVVVVRHMINAHEYVFQYLFFRGISIAIILVFFLFCKEGLKFYKNFLKIKISSVIGGISLAIAMTGFIFSVTKTTVAVTLFMLATMPFITAVIAFFVLRENLRIITFISMIIAFAGIIIMIYSDSLEGSIIGALTGLLSAVGFSVYTVTNRWRPDIPQFTTVALAGFFCAIFSFFFLGGSVDIFIATPSLNIYLSILHGSIVATGLILYSYGAKYLPSAELALLTLMEVVGGVIWVALPIFGINEIPSLNVILGGLIITGAVVLYGFNAKKQESQSHYKL